MINTDSLSWKRQGFSEVGTSFIRYSAGLTRRCKILNGSSEKGLKDQFFANNTKSVSRGFKYIYNCSPKSSHSINYLSIELNQHYCHSERHIVIIPCDSCQLQPLSTISPSLPSELTSSTNLYSLLFSMQKPRTAAVPDCVSYPDTLC